LVLRPIDRREVSKLWYLLPFVAALILISALYWETWTWWWIEWTSPGSFYAHAIFVPFFVGVMVWRNRQRLATAGWRPAWAGLVLLIFGMAVLMLGKRVDITAVESLSFVILLFGTTLLLCGRAWTQKLLFPLFFVVMMMPLVPDQLINFIAFPIQIKSAQLATAMLNLIQFHAVREGTLIQMDTYRMSVELPCSGFKTLVSLITFTAAFAYLVEAPLWKRWTLFLTTIPLSLFINALRIAFIGIVGELISTPAAAKFHDYSGFIVLTLAFLFLFNFARVLRCRRFLGMPLNEEEEERDRIAAEAAEAEGGPAEPAWWESMLAWRPATRPLRALLPYILAIDLVLGTALIASGYVTKAIHPQNPIATRQVPPEFTLGSVTWREQNDPASDKLTREVQEALSPSRVINRVYNGSDGSHLHLFITAGNSRKTFHDGHDCALGADAQMKDVAVVDVPTEHGPVSVQESLYSKRGSPDESETLFFYVVEGKILQKPDQIRKALIRQMLFGDAGKPSYFVRVVQFEPGSDPERRRQAFDFVAALWNKIGPILRGEQRGEYEGPPVPVQEPKQTQ
jgi:exosortase